MAKMSMSCPNLFPSPIPEVSAGSLYREHLIELVRRVGSVFCLIVLDSGGMAFAGFVAAALLDYTQIWNELLVSFLPIAIVFLLLLRYSRLFWAAFQ